MAALKPQDIAVILKLCGYGPRRPPYSHVAAELIMSPSEVHAAVKRAQAARLLHGSEMRERPIVSAIQEFLFHGLRYAFPPERGGTTRGLPTSYAAAPLRQVIAFSDEPIPVWPYPTGPQKGMAFEPLYRKAPEAALRDPALYELLALTDALRDGRARERKLAAEMIADRLRSVAHA